MKKSYRKLSLRSHPDINKHPQASVAFRMIKEAREALEDILFHNDTMRKNQERVEDIQFQKEDWREKERIMKAQ